MSDDELFNNWFAKRWPEFSHPKNSAFECWQAGAAQERERQLKWLPIETAPREGFILLWCPLYNCKVHNALPLTGCCLNDGPWVIVNADMAVQKVTPTHWMPLPAPPILDSH